jgi:hypothetical protein
VDAAGEQRFVEVNVRLDEARDHHALTDVDIGIRRAGRSLAQRIDTDDAPVADGDVAQRAVVIEPRPAQHQLHARSV